MDTPRKKSFTALSAAVIVILSILISSLNAQTGTKLNAKNSEKPGLAAAEPFAQKTSSSKDGNGQPSPAPSINRKDIKLRTTPAPAASPRQSGDRGVSVREPVMIDSTTTGSAQGIAVSTSDDLSAIVYNDGGDKGSNRVYVTVSDGRGIDWKTPFPVDSDRTAAPKHTQSDSIVVKGNSIYVAWKDERFSSTKPDLFFNVSHDGGVTWYGEELIDNAYSPSDIPGNSAGIRNWRMLVTSDPAGGDDHVYILFTVKPDKYAPIPPPGENAAEELYLVASHDGGVYFNPPVHVPQDIEPGTADIDAFAIAGEGTQISIAWQDNRLLSSLNDIWFQHSHDGGISWNQSDIALKSVPPGITNASGSLSIAQEGTTVIAAWQENREHSINEELRVNVSFDMGVTWLTDDKKIGGYLAGEHDVDSASLFIPEAPRTTFPVIRAVTPMITWTDDRTGSNEVYVAVSDDGGFSWSETGISKRGGRSPSFMGGDNSAGLSWIEEDLIGDTAVSSISSRAGTRWSTGFDYARLPGHQIISIESAYNPYYCNFICAFLARDRRIEDTALLNRVYVGGYRPQTCHAVVEDFSSGMNVRFDVSHWPETGPWFENDLYFGILISGGKGGAVLPPSDGRNIGLMPDLFLARSLKLIPGSLSSSITSGSGSTVSSFIPDLTHLPRGLVLYYAAVGYNPIRTPQVYGYITDVGELIFDTLGSPSN